MIIYKKNLPKFKKNLTEELDNFFRWADINLDQYLQKRHSPMLAETLRTYGSDWETEYPLFDNLEKAFLDEIDKINAENFISEESLLNLLIAITIDNQCEQFVEILFSNLKNIEFLKQIMLKTLEYKKLNCQSQFVAHIHKRFSKDKNYWYNYFIKNSSEPNAKSRAEYYLEYPEE